LGSRGRSSGTTCSSFSPLLLLLLVLPLPLLGQEELIPIVVVGEPVGRPDPLFLAAVERKLVRH
jgi:hypothetical protein